VVSVAIVHCKRVNKRERKCVRIIETRDIVRKLAGAEILRPKKYVIARG